jgi:hypothetical protein
MILLLIVACHEFSSTVPTEDLTLFFSLHSGVGTSPLCCEFSDADGEIGTTTIEVELYNVSPGGPAWTYWTSNNTYWSIDTTKDVFTLTNADETINLNEELEAIDGAGGGRLRGALAGERTGDFTLSLAREGNENAPKTEISLSTPVLSSHTDGGDVFESDEALVFELQDWNADIVPPEPGGFFYTLAINCGEGHLAQLVHCFEAPFDCEAIERIPEFADYLYVSPEMEDPFLRFETNDIYAALDLAETTACTMTFTQDIYAKADPAFHLGRVRAEDSTEFSLTFTKE